MRICRSVLVVLALGTALAVSESDPGSPSHDQAVTTQTSDSQVIMIKRTERRPPHRQQPHSQYLMSTSHYPLL